MSTTEAPKWYLEVEGNKTGPYSFDQIQGLYHEGEILGHHRVTADELQGKWITVEQLVQKHETELPKEPNLSSEDFRPPPRPPELPPGPTPTRSDPSVSLFDTLQAARDKKAAAKLSPPTNGSWAPRPERKRLPRQFWSILTLAVIIVLLIWGVARLLKAPAKTPANEPAVGRTTTPIPAAVAPPPGSLPAPKAYPRTPYTPSSTFHQPSGSKTAGTDSSARDHDDDRDRNEYDREMEREAEQNSALQQPQVQPAHPGQPQPPMPNPEDPNEPGVLSGDPAQPPAIAPSAPTE